MSLVLDLDVFKPTESKEVKLDGKTFDLTEIPFEISVQIYGLIPVVEKIEKEGKISREDYETIFRLVFDLFKMSDSNLDEMWLRKRITHKNFDKLMPFVFSALFDDGKKNEPPAQENQRADSLQ